MELSKEQIDLEYEKTREFLKDKGILNDVRVDEEWHCHFCDFTGNLETVSKHQQHCHLTNHL